MKNFKTSFSNTTNLKFSITQFNQTDQEFNNSLNNISGDLRQGIPFDELVIKCLNYLFLNCIENHSELKEIWSLDTAKSILDKNNDTGYTIINTKNIYINANVNKKHYYKEAFAFIQLAHYLNEIDLSRSQFFVYINHYLTTGEKLPENLYDDDLDYLHKKYISFKKLQKDNFKITAQTLIKNHFFGCLYLLCNDLDLDTSNFKSIYKFGRDYNALTKVSREFRQYFPFLLNEYDIKQANPHFIDMQINSNVGTNIYELISDTYKITREQAKEKFNTYINYRKYNKNREYYKAFFEPIYKEHTDKLIDLILDEKKPIWNVLSEWEQTAINIFKETNNLKNVSRLHDAIFIIDDVYKKEIISDFTWFSFNKKIVNRTNTKLDFKVLNNKPKYNYCNSIPAYLFKKIEIVKEKKISSIDDTFYNSSKEIKKDSFYTFKSDNKKGEYFKNNLFRIYENEFICYNANFNISYKGTFKDDVFQELTEKEFLKKIYNSVDVIRYLNKNISFEALRELIKNIIDNIFENGIYSFNKNYLFELLIERIKQTPIKPEAKKIDWVYLYDDENSNISFYEFQSLLYKAKREARKYFLAKKIIDTIKNSLKNDFKTFIDFKNIGIADKKFCPEIYDLIVRFNKANNINDVRTAKKIKEMYTKLETLYSNNSIRVSEIVYTMNYKDISSATETHRNTATKFKKWFNSIQDKKEIQSIIKELENIILLGTEREIKIDFKKEVNETIHLYNDYTITETIEITQEEERYFIVNIRQIKTPPKHYKEQ